MIFQKIKDARKAAKVTQDQLAKELGINRATLSKYESGIITPSIEQLQKIASVLKINLFDLLPHETQDQFKSVPQYFNSTDEEERELARNTERILIQNVINEELYEKLIGISESVYSTVLDGLDGVSDTELRNVLLGSFNSLNRVGKREAVERIAELELIPKYQAQKQPETDE